MLFFFFKKKKLCSRVKSFVGATLFELAKSYGRELIMLLAAEENDVSVKTGS